MIRLTEFFEPELAAAVGAQRFLGGESYE